MPSTLDLNKSAAVIDMTFRISIKVSVITGEIEIPRMKSVTWKSAPKIEPSKYLLTDSLVFQDI